MLAGNFSWAGFTRRRGCEQRRRTFRERGPRLAGPSWSTSLSRSLPLHCLSPSLPRRGLRGRTDGRTGARFRKIPRDLSLRASPRFASTSSSAAALPRFIAIAGPRAVFPRRIGICARRGPRTHSPIAVFPSLDPLLTRGMLSCFIFLSLSFSAFFSPSFVRRSALNFASWSPSDRGGTSPEVPSPSPFWRMLRDAFFALLLFRR